MGEVHRLQWHLELAFAELVTRTAVSLPGLVAYAQKVVEQNDARGYSEIVEQNGAGGYTEIWEQNRARGYSEMVEQNGARRVWSWSPGGLDAMVAD